MDYQSESSRASKLALSLAPFSLYLALSLFPRRFRARWPERESEREREREIDRQTASFPIRVYTHCFHPFPNETSADQPFF